MCLGYQQSRGTERERDRENDNYKLFDIWRLQKPLKCNGKKPDVCWSSLLNSLVLLTLEICEGRVVTLIISLFRVSESLLNPTLAGIQKHEELILFPDHRGFWGFWGEGLKRTRVLGLSCFLTGDISLSEVPGKIGSTCMRITWALLKTNKQVHSWAPTQSPELEALRTCVFEQVSPRFWCIAEAESSAVTSGGAPASVVRWTHRIVITSQKTCPRGVFETLPGG